jgi:hypothetical protein
MGLAIGAVAMDALRAIPQILLSPFTRRRNAPRRQQLPVTTSATATQPGFLTDKWVGWPNELDHGLYWWGPGNRFHKHNDPPVSLRPQPEARWVLGVSARMCVRFC